MNIRGEEWEVCLMDKVTSLGVSWVHSKVGCVGGEVGRDNYRWKIKEMEGEGWVFVFFLFPKGLLLGMGIWMNIEGM